MIRVIFIIFMCSIATAAESPCCIAEKQTQCDKQILEYIKSLEKTDKVKSKQVQKLQESGIYAPCDLLMSIEKERK